MVLMIFARIKKFLLKNLLATPQSEIPTNLRFQKSLLPKDHFSLMFFFVNPGYEAEDSISRCQISILIKYKCVAIAQNKVGC